MSTATAPHWIEKQHPTMQPGLRQRAYIANILPIPWTITRSYGVFEVKACEEGAPYSLTAIDSRLDSCDIGDKKRMETPLYADDIAKDIVNNCNNDAGEKSDFGVFICGHAGPTKAELEKANERVDEFGSMLCRAADVEWERSKNSSNISDTQRMFGRRFNLTREWIGRPMQMEVCPGCGENIRAGVAICKTCNAILDRPKAMELGLIPAEPKPEKHAAKG